MIRAKYYYLKIFDIQTKPINQIHHQTDNSKTGSIHCRSFNTNGDDEADRCIKSAD